ncbi:hypothetical protein M9Y10_038235 [Tritrichomonas musculus]|uniref:Uncharacterized protein n=1 Tax=Tritrichomonas musculus TaxID=1915356 RepID=A0ABR2K7T6_9EUKA
MRRQQDVSEANNLKELLNSSIDPGDESFWENLKHCVLTSKEITSLNRRSILNLKLIFAEVPNNLNSISTISHLLKLLKPSLKSDIGGEIGTTINTIFLQKENLNVTDISAFLSSTSYICSGNFNLKRAILDEIIEQFSEYLGLDKLKDCSPIVLSSLFELMITLISQCPENRTLLSQYLNEPQLSKCLNIIKGCNDSLAQMLVAEWLWRSINCLPTKPNIKKIFGPLSESFNKISMGNFRESLHDFIMQINQKFNLSITHIEFDDIRYNCIELDIKGWIDLNPNSIALWLINQSSRDGSQNTNLPDVVVLRSSMIYNCKATQKQISFNTKERLQTFNSISRERPCKFEFSLSKKIDKAKMNSFLKLAQKKNKKVLEAERKEVTGKSKNIKAVEKSNASAIKVDTKVNFADKKRIYAKNVKSNSKQRSLIVGNGSDSDDEMIFEMKQAVDSELNNDDYIFGKTTQEKDNNMNKIEEMLNDFQKTSIESINQTEESAKIEINGIVAKLEDNMRMLHQLAQQHKELTDITTKESLAIGESVANLETDFRVKNDEMIQKRNSISLQINNEIDSEKTKFVQETNIAFENNAIVGLTTHLSNLREIMCEAPF